MATIKCAFSGCPCTTEQGEDWPYIFRPPLPSGLYCPAHADAIEAEEMGDNCDWCREEPAEATIDGIRMCHACFVAYAAGDTRTLEAREPRQ
jgi:hypothetical protein